MVSAFLTQITIHAGALILYLSNRPRLVNLKSWSPHSGFEGPAQKHLYLILIRLCGKCTLTLTRQLLIQAKGYIPALMPESAWNMTMKLPSFLYSLHFFPLILAKRCVSFL